MTLVTAEIAVERCLAVLDRHPSGLFSDFDGTLSTIAPTPDSARPFKGTSEAIARICLLVDEFAIVTGRAASDALERIGVPEIRVIGNHGLEMVYQGEHTANPIGIASRASIERALAEIAAGISALTEASGMVFENKIYSASIHYRNSPHPDVVEMLLKPIVLKTAADHDLRITSGKLLFELRPQAIVSKGTALADLILVKQLSGAIFLGDDVTDVDGFETLRRLSDAGGIKTLAVGVMSEETPPSVIEQSDILLSGVEECVTMLTILADRLEAK